MIVPKQLAYGTVTLLPYLGPHIASKITRGREGPNSARYAYSVWLRHLVYACENGLDCEPHTVAELGPGGSLGMGLAALISGSSRYYALDVIDFSDTMSNLRVFDELVYLFRRRENIPGNDEFPLVSPKLESYDFPEHVLDEARLRYALAENRLKSIRDSITKTAGGGDNHLQGSVG